MNKLSPDTLPIDQRLIISIYDYSEIWSGPYIKAGYPCIPWDYKIEGDILENFGGLIQQIEEAIENGYYPYGFLFAPPCTDFASSGARWWAEKDIVLPHTIEDIHKYSTATSDITDVNPHFPFENTTEYSYGLVSICFVLMSWCKENSPYDIKFWALENPKGRLDTTVLPQLRPYRRLRFDPCDFGEPFTKETLLWGDFNPELVKTPVKPIEASHTMDEYYGITKLKYRDRAQHRNKTPKGFANAFFHANR
jgi:hypothetical protein